MNSKLFIADKVKVGFNPREDTYSGKLGYVIGHDGKKWRKEPSWDGWRYHHMDEADYQQKRLEQYNDRLAKTKKDHLYYIEQSAKNPNHWYKEYAEMTEEKFIEKQLGSYEKFKPSLGRVSSDKGLMPLEFDNVPTEGFVLNKKVGGYSNGWDHRSTYCRVYDPRGFEFEINVPNLLFILQECNAMKGKGLEGTFVYAWEGKDLVLLPTSSQDYQESQKFTEMQSQKIGVKDLVEGCTYKTKQMEDYIYMGRFNCFSDNYQYSSQKHATTTCFKSHVFYKVDENKYGGNRFETFAGLTKFASKISDTPVSNYAELLDEFNASEISGTITTPETIEMEIPTEIQAYYGRSEVLGDIMLPVDANTYEIYKLECGDVEYTNGNYYHNRKGNIRNYNLTSKRAVTIKDGDFKVKTIKPKVIEKISFNGLKDMKMKLLTIKKNNKERVLLF